MEHRCVGEELQESCQVQMCDVGSELQLAQRQGLLRLDVNWLTKIYNLKNKIRRVLISS